MHSNNSNTVNKKMKMDTVPIKMKTPTLVKKKFVVNPSIMKGLGSSMKKASRKPKSGSTKTIVQVYGKRKMEGESNSFTVKLISEDSNEVKIPFITDPTARKYYNERTTGKILQNGSKGVLGDMIEGVDPIVVNTNDDVLYEYSTYDLEEGVWDDIKVGSYLCVSDIGFNIKRVGNYDKGIAKNGKDSGRGYLRLFKMFDVGDVTLRVKGGHTMLLNGRKFNIKNSMNFLNIDINDDMDTMCSDLVELHANAEKNKDENGMINWLVGPLNKKLNLNIPTHLRSMCYQIDNASAAIGEVIPGLDYLAYIPIQEESMFGYKKQNEPFVPYLKLDTAIMYNSQDGKTQETTSISAIDWTGYEQLGVPAEHWNKNTYAVNLMRSLVGCVYGSIDIAASQVMDGNQMAGDDGFNGINKCFDTTTNGIVVDTCATIKSAGHLITGEQVELVFKDENIAEANRVIHKPLSYGKRGDDFVNVSEYVYNNGSVGILNVVNPSDYDFYIIDANVGVKSQKDAIKKLRVAQGKIMSNEKLEGISGAGPTKFIVYALKGEKGEKGEN